MTDACRIRTRASGRGLPPPDAPFGPQPARRCRLSRRLAPRHSLPSREFHPERNHCVLRSIASVRSRAHQSIEIDIMSQGRTPFDYAKALQDPASVFRQPADILVYPGLSREQRLNLLRQWERDAHNLVVAEGEGMTGGEQSQLS